MANFFEQQAQARTNTTRLVVLYAIAVTCIVVMTAAFLTFFLGGLDRAGVNDPSAASESIQIFFYAALATLSIIGVGTLISIGKIGHNGANIALMLGGTPVAPDTTNLLERRLLNVVEEMAIASGISIPRVFILRGETGINAFAAGTQPNEAVVGVTRGTLEKLTRDELQGVVAHEFSHIFNGDMKLNIRLMGVLGGIMTIATIGRHLMDSRRSSSNRNKKGDTFLFGLGLFVLGYLGVFFARLIKAAVSRQREYLADASALQYTRNPFGIGGALMKIGNDERKSDVSAAYAEEASHLFFGSISSFSALFATHPPLDDRINRISPRLLAEWKAESAMSEQEARASGGASVTDHAVMGFKPMIVPHGPPTEAPAVASAPRSQTEAAAQRASAIVDKVGEPAAEDLAEAKRKLNAIPSDVRDLLRTARGAFAGILSLLLNSESGTASQAALIKDTLGEEPLLLAQEMRRAMGESAHRGRLLILELAMPALKILNADQKRSYLILCRELVHADGRYDLFEYIALTLMDHQFFGSDRKSRPRPRLVAPRTANDISTVVSALAYAGTDNMTRAKAAFDAGVDAVREATRYPITFRSQDECRLQQIADAIDRLSFLEPMPQKAVLDACVRVILHDRVVNQEEAELLKVICVVLEAPLPALAV